MIRDLDFTCTPEIFQCSSLFYLPAIWQKFKNKFFSHQCTVLKCTFLFFSVHSSVESFIKSLFDTVFSHFFSCCTNFTMIPYYLGNLKLCIHRVKGGNQTQQKLAKNTIGCLPCCLDIHQAREQAQGYTCCFEDERETVALTVQITSLSNVWWLGLSRGFETMMLASQKYFYCHRSQLYSALHQSSRYLKLFFFSVRFCSHSFMLHSACYCHFYPCNLSLSIPSDLLACFSFFGHYISVTDVYSPLTAYAQLTSVDIFCDVLPSCLS